MKSENVSVQTSSGELLGVYEEELFVFKGIPYAEPPTGELRWLPPQPVQPWSESRPAQQFGPICPQDNRPTPIPGRKPSVEPQDENCLFLNIWTPAIDDGKRAVMVWIHGGAFLHGSGSSPMNPGSTLPKRGGVVLVTINYRLGVLGFLRLTDITNGKIPSTGNEALLDQIAALQWVKNNILAFGGDPDNITVFGESAGAESIGALLAMPKSKGLFQKAILQSGASKSQSAERATRTAEKYLELLGISGTEVESLKSTPPEKLIQTFTELPPATGGVGPVRDGEVLPEVPLNVIEQGSAEDITVLAGSNLEEAKLFALLMSPDIVNLDEENMVHRLRNLVPEEYLSGLIEKYRVALAERELPVTPFEIYTAIQGDQHFRMPNIRLCEIQEKLGTPTFGYVFNCKSAASGFGACHALDVGFIFGNLNDEFHGSSPDAWKLAGTMQDAWIAFAKTGDPSCPGLGNWPRYGRERMMMVLGSDSHVET
ncbi:MAG: carboxylesterase/lipase family protein, partial [Dehalococcoidales bacterium]